MKDSFKSVWEAASDSRFMFSELCFVWSGMQCRHSYWCGDALASIDLLVLKGSCQMSCVNLFIKCIIKWEKYEFSKALGFWSNLNPIFKSQLKSIILKRLGCLKMLLMIIRAVDRLSWKA